MSATPYPLASLRFDAVTLCGGGPHATFAAMRGTEDTRFMRRAIALARRALGCTSPNPMVGAVLVRKGRILGEGWHHRAGQPHAEIEALQDCERNGFSPAGATLYVTLEPCCTHGRTPPCTDAIRAAKVRRVVVAATDPNPRHAGRGFNILRQAGIETHHGVLASEATRLNEAFNHWIVHRTPFVTVKAAMTLDGKTATATGESKWITGEMARRHAMTLRRGVDAILAGVNTVIADDPSLTLRSGPANHPRVACRRRIVLDPRARTPIDSKIVTDPFRATTTIVTTAAAPRNRRQALSQLVAVWEAPVQGDGIDLPWLLARLGSENVTHLLVEGGGETAAGFLLHGHAHRIAFYYAPKVIGGRDARRAVAGDGIGDSHQAVRLSDVESRQVGEDLFVTARVATPSPAS